MEGLNQIRADLVVYLHPSKASSTSEAILGELSSLLFTYNESLDGVVLAYDPKISSNLAHIIPGISPYLGVHLRADLLMFSPKPDMMVEGEVVSVNSNSINAVVLGFASASVAREDVRGEFRFRSRKGEYVSRLSKKHKVREGTILRFRVKCFDGETLHVSGSMVGEDTGCVRWLDTNVDAWNRVESSDVRRKVEEVKEEEMCMNDVKVKKSKKMKVKEDDSKGEIGVEAKQEMLLSKDREKSMKARVREEGEDNKEEDVMVRDQEMSTLTDERSKKVKLEENGEEFGLKVKEEMKEMPSLKDGEKSKKSRKKKSRVMEEQNNKEEDGFVRNQEMPPLEDQKLKNIKQEVIGEDFGLETKEEMQSWKDGEKSKKSKKAKVKEEQDNTEENGLVNNHKISALKEEDAKPKKSKKRRKEQS